MKALVFSLAVALSGAAAQANEVQGSAIVRDADTLVVAGVPVRLNGIDAPEPNQPYGLEARVFMQSLVAGRTVLCQLNGERTYDRQVGTCFIDVNGETIDVAAAVISAGFGLDCRRYSGGRYRAFETPDARSYLQQAGYC